MAAGSPQADAHILSSPTMSVGHRPRSPAMANPASSRRLPRFPAAPMKMRATMLRIRTPGFPSSSICLHVSPCSVCQSPLHGRRPRASPYLASMPKVSSSAISPSPRAPSVEHRRAPLLLVGELGGALAARGSRRSGVVAAPNAVASTSRCPSKWMRAQEGGRRSRPAPKETTPGYISPDLLRRWEEDLADRAHVQLTF